MENAKQTINEIEKKAKLRCSICGSRENVTLVNLSGVIVVSACSNCLPVMDDFYVTVCKGCNDISWEYKKYAAARMNNPERKKNILKHPYHIIRLIESCITCDKENFIFDEYANFQKAPSKQA